MGGSINLLPKKTLQQVREDLRKYFLDVGSAVIVLVAVLAAFIIISVDNVQTQNANNLNNKIKQEMSNVASYKDVIKNLIVLQRLLTQYKSIENASSDQEVVLTDLEKLKPGNVILSDYSFGLNPDNAGTTPTSDKTVDFTASSNDELDIARMIINLSSSNTANKNFGGVEISKVSVAPLSNDLIFTVSTTYHSN